MDAFQPVAEANFERRVMDYLRENHPEAVVETPSGGFALTELDEETLRRMVRAGLRAARGYGLTWESSLTSFVVVMFLVAPNFHAHPLVRRVLTDEEVEPDRRVEHLWEQTTEENWEAVQENYDAGAWGLSAPEGT
ncbi:MAG TPA: hypothetical protein VER08_11830 [Pyrinomonadaceae bacterium]|nr:hypothetical protein [Pyrinomonadaceae bacterium]